MSFLLFMNRVSFSWCSLSLPWYVMSRGTEGGCGWHVNSPSSSTHPWLTHSTHRGCRTIKVHVSSRTLVCGDDSFLIIRLMSPFVVRRCNILKSWETQRNVNDWCNLGGEGWACEVVWAAGTFDKVAAGVLLMFQIAHRQDSPYPSLSTVTESHPRPAQRFSCKDNVRDYFPQCFFHLFTIHGFVLVKVVS